MSQRNTLPPLMPCNCGSTATSTENWKDRRIIVECVTCGRKVWSDTRRQAYTAWNRGRVGDCGDEARPATIEDKDAEIATLRADNARLREEVRILRLYGNKDCTAQADEALVIARTALAPREPPCALNECDSCEDCDKARPVRVTLSPGALVQDIRAKGNHGWRLSHRMAADRLVAFAHNWVAHNPPREPEPGKAVYADSLGKIWESDAEDEAWLYLQGEPEPKEELKRLEDALLSHGIHRLFIDNFERTVLNAFKPATPEPDERGPEVGDIVAVRWTGVLSRRKWDILEWTADHSADTSWFEEIHIIERRAAAEARMGGAK